MHTRAGRVTTRCTGASHDDPLYPVDPEFRDLIPPLSGAERDALEKDVALRGNRDPIVVWRDDGHLIIVDGHHRHEICRKVGAKLKKPIEIEFADRAEAMVWILTNQFARRNLNDAQRGYLIGKRFNAETPGQGARTDLGTGQAGVAQRLAAEFKLTDRAIRDCGRFAEAVDILTDSLGVDVRAAILDKSVPFSRDEIRTIANLPRHERATVWEAALADRSSLKRVLADQKRKDTRKDRADAVKIPGEARAPAAERYDLADLVRLIATVWRPERIEDYTPSYTQQVTLEANMDGALRTLITLATLRGWGEEALEDYAAERSSAARGDQA